MPLKPAPVPQLALPSLPVTRPKTGSALKIIFAGTPEFARVALERLLASGFDIALVLTQPDRPSGWGLKLQASPVKQFAQAHGLAVVQPRSLRLDGEYPDDAAAAREAILAAGADAHQRVANKRVNPRANGCRARQFQGIGKHHHPAFRETVRHLPDEWSKDNVSAHKHHLQDRLAPVGVKLGFQQRQRGKQQRVITERREKLRGDDGHHAFRPE